MAPRVPDPEHDQLVPACLAGPEKKPINRRMIDASASDIAAKLVAKYGMTPITIVPIMTGAFVYANDILRHLHQNDRIVFESVMLRPVWAKSYKGSAQGAVEFHSFGVIQSHIRDRNVILIDDILDTGMTLNVVQAFVRSLQPRDLTTVVMCRKPGKGDASNMLCPIDTEFVGLDIEDEFVVGYGLDLDEKYRELPTIKKFVPGKK